MPRSVPIVASLLLLFVLVFGVIKASPSFPPWTGSVLQLQDDQGEPLCSAFVINKPKRLLMTADHCVTAANGSGSKIYVRGAEAREIYHLPIADIAVLEADEGPTVLPPALPPDLTPIQSAGEKFYTAGFSRGGMNILEQEVILPMITIPPMVGPFIIYKNAVKPGMSGGPIIRWNKNGPVSVVGVNSLAHPRGNLSMTRPFNEVFELFREYFELPPVGGPPAQ